MGGAGRALAWASAAIMVACSGESGLFGDAGPGSTSGGTTTTGQGGQAGGAGATGGEPSSGGGPGAGGGSAGHGGSAGGCTWGGAPCGEGFYCDAPGCGQGICQPILAEGGELAHLDPVCGCDGVTAFNPTIAQRRGVAMAHPGACTKEEHVPCDNLMTGCPEGLSCNVQVADATACFLGNTTAGGCWALPPTCANEPRGRACAPPSLCGSVCTLIENQVAWREDPSCAFSP
jgi:hypothetical protein